MKNVHEQQIEQLKKDYEDKIAQAWVEKEKDHVLILDSKIVEYEDQLLDTENRLHREYIDKIAKYQEIIKDLKQENQDLYEENSLKQRQIDENMNTINDLKDKISIQNTSLDHYRSHRKSSLTHIPAPQSFCSENKENKYPIDNLKGYYHKLKKGINSAQGPTYSTSTP